jgi:hypothetical protein
LFNRCVAPGVVRARPTGKYEARYHQSFFQWQDLSDRTENAEGTDGSEKTGDQKVVLSHIESASPCRKGRREEVPPL